MAPKRSTAGGERESREPVSFNTAIGFVEKVKTHYADHTEIVNQFLDILQEYQRKSKPIQEVHEKVRVLFSDSPELQADFEQFLPVGAETPARDAA